MIIRCQLVLVLVWTSFFGSLPASAQDKVIKKSSLRILYVGANPDPESQGQQFKASRSLPKKFPKRRVQLALNRPKAFREFLERYFEKVEIKTSIDYQPDDSQAFDVTIFDQVPGFIKGQVKTVQLPDGFPHAAIMIGDSATGILSHSAKAPLMGHL